MALLSEEMDSDLLRLWSLMNELSEQLNTNRAIAATLQQQAAQAKGQALHTGTGFVLRRFNTDLAKEVFESELERMNASLIIENQQLLHENKQINSLLKEYEQTLETVMAKFRAQAHATQRHELTLTRHYESLLQARENNSLNQDLGLSVSTFESLTKISDLLRRALRSLSGEDPDADVSREADRVDGLQSPEHLSLFHEEVMREWDKAASSKLSSGSIRRGLLSNNRARGGIGRGAFAPHTAWLSPDPPTQRKGPNYFKEFPTA
ncbi:uncharacterized protein EI90DRAFT_3043369 [Cantharellus anzutake]|uniref:uncharacterized protein n=1 Tax=Cantharellus anzutake TaxID=1750568 RepID=UPI001902D881|nr:uncharacterized protein EI90DRAFT_3043369 [Cantharellus anzutake]KAF8337562.1 hypothetical protein EI90DRAFT_3043369 [Cantharellus anzutake]